MQKLTLTNINKYTKSIMYYGQNVQNLPRTLILIDDYIKV